MGNRGDVYCFILVIVFGQIFFNAFPFFLRIVSELYLFYHTLIYFLTESLCVKVNHFDIYISFLLIFDWIYYSTVFLFPFSFFFVIHRFSCHFPLMKKMYTHLYTYINGWFHFLVQEEIFKNKKK